VPSSSSYNESALFYQLKQGDEQALRQIVHHYYPKLMGFAISITKSKQVSEEMVQETFLRLWLKREELELDNLGAWLHKVLANLAYSHLKKMTVEGRLLSYLKHTELPYDTSTEHTINQKEGGKLLKQAIEQLPPQQKQVYQLSREEGMSRDEIAQELNISPNTVRNHLAKALESIRDFVSKAAKSLFSIF
jgi:RNA polymerase sigma-70 factor (ECF subfamily)